MDLDRVPKARPVTSRRHFLQRSGRWTLAGVGAALDGVVLRLRAGDPPQEAPPEVVTLVSAYRREYSVPGMQIAIRRGSRRLYLGCFGEADPGRRELVRPDSRFRIASDSKAFTAAAMFRLIETGHVRLDDRIFSPGGILRPLAELGPQQDWIQSITVHHLLTHTGGGWGNTGDDPMFERPDLDHEQLIAWTIRTHPLQYPPGTHYAYSNFGYCLLGRVIERACGQPYSLFVRDNILRPAGVTDARIGTHSPAAGEVHYHSQDDGNPYDIPVARMDSHGGWIATAEDLARFLACLFSPMDREGASSILTPESLRRMTEGTAANPGYACGLAVNRAGNAWHSGSLPGTTSLMVHTHSGLSWAAVLNTRSQREGASQRLDEMLWEIARSVPQWQA